MNNFKKGFATGIIAVGLSNIIYEIGRRDERRKLANLLKEANEVLEEAHEKLLNAFRNEEDEETE